jgi:hypothetical protein
MGDDSENLRAGPGHLIKFPMTGMPASLEGLAASDPAVAEYLNSIHKMENGDLTEVENESD